MMAAALFLLLFTAADLAFPAACGEDGGLRGTDQTVSGAPGSHASLQSSTAQDENGAPQDDCFCCCSHLLAGQRFVLAMSVAGTGNPEAAITLSPSRTVQTAAEPPRLG
jgi:hypothetical protein